MSYRRQLHNQWILFLQIVDEHELLKFSKMISYALGLYIAALKKDTENVRNYRDKFDYAASQKRKYDILKEPIKAMVRIAEGKSNI